MEIFPIFEVEHGFITHLWTSEYDNCETDEFTQTFENWADPDYLHDFFINNYKDLMSGFYDFKSLEDAVIKTQELALQFEEKLLEAAQNTDEINLELRNYFHTLSNNDFRHECILQQTKTKIKAQKWLRMYAVKVNPSCYVVATNAIKLTKDMVGDHFDVVFEKLEITQAFLNSKEYYTFEDVIEKKGLL